MGAAPSSKVDLNSLVNIFSNNVAKQFVSTSQSDTNRENTTQAFKAYCGVYDACMSTSSKLCSDKTGNDRKVCCQEHSDAATKERVSSMASCVQNQIKNFKASKNKNVFSTESAIDSCKVLSTNCSIHNVNMSQIFRFQTSNISDIVSVVMQKSTIDTALEQAINATLNNQTNGLSSYVAPNAIKQRIDSETDLFTSDVLQKWTKVIQTKLESTGADQKFEFEGEGANISNVTLAQTVDIVYSVVMEDNDQTNMMTDIAQKVSNNVKTLTTTLDTSLKKWMIIILSIMGALFGIPLILYIVIPFVRWLFQKKE